MKHVTISYLIIVGLALAGFGQQTLRQSPDKTPGLPKCEPGEGPPQPAPTVKRIGGAKIPCDIRSWAGVWQTNYGVMKLHFDDEAFSGNYGPSAHSGSGRFDAKTPCVLRGIWRHTGSNATGRFTFRITAPKTFKGNWSSGNADPDLAGSPWAGTRLLAPVVVLPKNLTLTQLKLEQAKHRAKLNSEYLKAYREMLNAQINTIAALQKKYLKQGDKQKAMDAARMLAGLRRLIGSLPSEEKKMPPEESPPDGPGLEIPAEEAPPDGPGLELPAEEASPDGPGLIKDSKLEAAVRKVLGKLVGIITPSDLASLEKLEASFLGITTIAGLQLATNLTSLNISHNPISDITPLAGLTKLKRLLIYKIRITDLKPLADLTNVEFVTFWETNVSDLTPLKSWKNLQSIELRLTKVTDYTPLHGLTNLKSLATNRRLISDEQLALLKKALPNCKLEIEKRNLQLQ